MNLFFVDGDLIARMALLDAVQSIKAGQDWLNLKEFDAAQDAWNTLIGSPLKPDLVFCEERMSGMTGLELLQNMRDNPSTRHIPFVLISSGDANTIKHAAALGADGFIVKPYALAEVVPRLGKYFHLAKAKALEDPDETMRRLKINRDRYETYLAGLSAQIKQLLTEVRTAEVDRALTKVRERADALISSCTTLGLWRSSQLMAMAKTAGFDQVLDLLAEITQQLHQQTTRVNDAQSWAVSVIAQPAQTVQGNFLPKKTHSR